MRKNGRRLRIITTPKMVKWATLIRQTSDRKKITTNHAVSDFKMSLVAPTTFPQTKIVMLFDQYHEAVDYNSL